MRETHLSHSFFSAFFIIAVIFLLGLGSAVKSQVPERRYALVIGNSAYQHHTRLRNPVKDSQEVAKVLNELGFLVINDEDLTRAEMNQLITRFSETIRTGGVALFYYAGHAVQVNGINYMIPVDANIKRASEVRQKAVDMNAVLVAMRGSPINPKIILLDACRDNPLTRSLTPNDAENLLIPGTQRGLAELRTDVTDPTGIFISYATTPGRTAIDGVNSSPYRDALLRHIRTPGLRLHELFELVSEDVMQQTGNEQIPWVNKTPTKEFWFKAPIKISDFQYKIEAVDDRVEIYVNETPVRTSGGVTDWETVPTGRMNVGDNALKIQVYNQGSYTGGIFRKREGWRYAIKFRADGQEWGLYEDSENVPPEERHGDTFTVFKATISVDKDTGRITLKDPVKSKGE